MALIGSYLLSIYSLVTFEKLGTYWKNYDEINKIY